MIFMEPSSISEKEHRADITAPGSSRTTVQDEIFSGYKDGEAGIQLRGSGRNPEQLKINPSTKTLHSSQDKGKFKFVFMFSFQHKPGKFKTKF